MSCAPEGRAGERRTAERAAGYQGRATGVLGRGAAPGLEVGVDKNPGGVGGPSSAQQTPPPPPPCLFSPAPLGLAGRPLTTSCDRSQLVWTLLLPPVGVSSRSQWLQAPLPARIVYTCLLPTVWDPVVVVMSSGSWGSASINL